MTKNILMAALAAMFMAVGVSFADGLNVYVPSQPAGQNQADPTYGGFLSSCTVSAAGYHNLVAGTQNTVTQITVSELDFSTAAALNYAVFYDTYSYSAVNERGPHWTTSASDAIQYKLNPGMRFTSGVILWLGDDARACILYMKQ